MSSRLDTTRFLCGSSRRMLVTLRPASVSPTDFCKEEVHSDGPFHAARRQHHTRGCTHTTRCHSQVLSQVRARASRSSLCARLDNVHNVVRQAVLFAFSRKAPTLRSCSPLTRWKSQSRSQAAMWHVNRDYLRASAPERNCFFGGAGDLKQATWRAGTHLLLNDEDLGKGDGVKALKQQSHDLDQPWLYSTLVSRPLCERLAVCITPVDSLLAWRQRARSMAMTVGDKFADVDGGPTASELLREIDWLLDDAVAAVSSDPKLSGRAPLRDSNVDLYGADMGVSDGVWSACSWEQLKLRLADHMSSPHTWQQNYVLDDEHESRGLPDLYVSAGASAPQQISRKPGLDLRPGQKAASVGEDGRDGGEEAVAVDGKVEERGSEKQLRVLMRETIDWMEVMWRRRIHQRLPFQYIVGAAHWRELVIAVQPGVLIPRPETELLIDLVEEAIHGDSSLANHPWADMGTGSGAIAIALARMLPEGSTVYAVDCSDEAIATAVSNVGRYGLEERVRVLQGKWFSPLENLKGKLGGVVSNPPYIPTEDLQSLQAEVRLHEPVTALDGGEQLGSTSLIEVCQGAAKMLRPGGFLALETNGGNQAEHLAAFLRGYSDSRVDRCAEQDDDEELAVLLPRTYSLSASTYETNRNKDMEAGCHVREMQSDLQTRIDQDAASNRGSSSYNCFKDVRIVKDLADVSRFVVAYRCSP